MGNLAPVGLPVERWANGRREGTNARRPFPGAVLSLI